MDAESCFGAHFGDVFRHTAQHLDDLVFRVFDVCLGQVYFIDNGQRFEVVFQGEIEVAHRLSFYALGSVHQEDGAFAGSQSAGHFVGKVHVAGRVDQIQNIVLALIVVYHAHGVALDRDALFALQVHVVQHLRHIHAVYHVGCFQEAIRQGGFPVVDMGYDAEVSYIFLFHCMSLIFNQI